MSLWKSMEKMGWRRKKNIESANFEILDTKFDDVCKKIEQEEYFFTDDDGFLYIDYNRVSVDTMLNTKVTYIKKFKKYTKPLHEEINEDHISPLRDVAQSICGGIIPVETSFL